MRQALKDLALAALLVALCALAACLAPAAHAQTTGLASAGAQAPQEAARYRRLLIRTAHAYWGLDAPVAVFAAQVHQESAWRADAVSRVGAQGMAQFMPATTRWIAGLHPHLAAQQPFNPAWALSALVTYDRWLYDRAPARYTPRERMHVALRAYNGGLGHWQAEAAATGAAQPTPAQVDAACGRARRAPVHCAENLGYPQRILVVLQPRYAAWGPGL
ncbi:Transglycosylase SLT domain-containing protein [Oryzisolibacter propanilivorax]|uniref:Transglycosylase SLT domain-containing protein n=1 Tax=Oryzisolibacter propanilivorax TaxID=1527607 RepID=A0A1G9UAI7_9BURK|nr:transglycosylase SLT domain-containing protein [Oryzisolibacter propanilivorax]SDM56941.1 Transglycosylase SLT domain-containing protein [Oryzisolibacter propanilivorax]